MVNGHPAQIKEGLAGATDFVAHHPGVDVFTGPDVAVAMHDPSVHALDVLDKDSIHAATEQTLNGVDGVVDPGFHIPFITMAFSSWREASLLWNEKKTFAHALKDVGVDVVGVGAGALAGAKAGGLLGAWFGPVGAAIGGVAGSIVGAIGGKFTATAIRYAGFREARDAYNRSVTNAQKAVELEIRMSKERIIELQAQYQQRFAEDRGKVEESAKRRIGAISIRFEDELFAFCEQFPHFLRDLKSEAGTRREGGTVATTLAQHIGMASSVRERPLSWGRPGLVCSSPEVVNAELHTYAEVTPRNFRTLYAEVQRFLEKYEFELESLLMSCGGWLMNARWLRSRQKRFV